MEGGGSGSGCGAGDGQESVETEKLVERDTMVEPTVAGALTEGLAGTQGLTDEGGTRVHGVWRGRRITVASTAQKPRVELLAHGTEAKTGAQQNVSTTAGVRMTGKPEKPGGAERIKGRLDQLRERRANGLTDRGGDMGLEP